jgi:protein O-GlcNAc transferase
MKQLTIQEAFDLAFRHHQAGRLREAEDLYRQILSQQPEHAEATHHLGLTAHQGGRNDIALDLILRAIALRPDYAEAHGNLGIVLKEQGRLDEAIAAYRQAIVLSPGLPDAHSNLGIALKEKGQLDEAIAAYRQAIALRPDFPEALSNLGIALTDQGQLDEAIAAHRRALALNPSLPQVYNNLGNALAGQGRLDEAIEAFRRAIAIRPTYALAHSNLILTLHYHPAYDMQAIAEELRRWNHEHASPLRRLIKSHSNNRSADRRLRIGYVSPDFREHPVGRFLLPLLTHHDRDRFEVFGYAQVPAPDEITRRLASCTDGWRSILGLSDAQAVDLIRRDEIDILVDLTMHTSNNRLRIFAHKPAPVQVAYLACCSSTGLETINYRLSDPYLDPTGEESFYSEQTIRLPDTYWCYESRTDSIEVGPLPALARGAITFGCLNNFRKVSEPALGLWIQLLRAVPDAQLLLGSQEGGHRRRVRERLEREGIDASRVRFAGRVGLQEYLRLYHEIDIALDTFPYAGGATTCDAIWMGVPTVSLVGRTAVGRGGLSILSNVGVPELVARSEEEYLRIARELANNLPQLIQLRSTLRQRMEQSPLMDAPKFARNVESAYRQMWHAWCARAIDGS